jgi:iron complex outermembrane recepter protein
LPSFLSSTGIEFNYTYSESDSGDEDLYGNSLPLQSNSKHQSNLILWYDKDGLNVRLAYNWKSAEYEGRAGLNTSGQPLNLGNWVEPTGYLDMSVSYWLNEHVSFSLSGTNLTEQSKKSYAQFDSQLQSIWVQERRFNAGVTFTY